MIWIMMAAVNQQNGLQFMLSIKKTYKEKLRVQNPYTIVMIMNH